MDRAATRELLQVMEQKSGRSLRAIPLFDGVEESFLRNLEACCVWKSFSSDQQIISYLDSSDDVFFIVSGKVRVVIYSASGKAVTFREIGPGGIFGEFAAIDGRPRSATVEGIIPGKLAQLSSRLFREALVRDANFMNTTMAHLIRQVRILTERIHEFSALDVNHRIYAELLRLAEQSGCGGDTAQIPDMITHSEFASRISTHREAVTRELNRLARIGLIERRGSRLVITDLPRLCRMVHEASSE